MIDCMFVWCQNTYVVLTRGALLDALTPQSLQGGGQGDAVGDFAHAFSKLVAAVQQLVAQPLNLQGNRLRI